MDNCGQEMTLTQYVEQLPECHRAHKEYQALVEAQKWLDALGAAGVDNWEGISEAHSIMTEQDA